MTNPDDPYSQYPAHPGGESGPIPPYQGQYQQPGGYQQPGFEQQGYQQPSYQQPGGYSVPPYPQQQYGYGYGGYPQPVGTNGLAIGSLIASIAGLLCGVGFIVGIVLGVIALGQIKTTGEQGKGMAIAGVAIGGVAVAAIVIVVIIAAAAGAFAN
ncbi:DUF4190 domain-containing protein [Antrihabitans cavernicola]|uniref:DUF4190 domain-containing protein n=1 Tax=Antrihabitans cavernicola TaxID=2495913 RepID=A0A5A7SFE3_9NOCA|nr:DUF4190 domain-containing protein [Spelaeibacter cavernicola]KAA0024546.1 DUF4190 domain-containing protein [Spelaeibacter cavernicola]